MLRANHLAGFGEGGGLGNDRFTRSLLHCDGADASTTFPDLAVGANARVWTANGNAQVDTAQSKFGGASLLLDGTGDYLSTPSAADFIYAGDYTVEAWIRPNSVGTNQGVISKANAGGYSPWLIFAATGTLQIYASSTGSSWDIINAMSFGTVSTGTWYHVALVRSGNNYFAFQNGALNNSTTGSATPLSDSSSVLIGRQLAGVEFNGWVDEVRFSNKARWTAAFTPSVAPYS
jgi:hypothetical protein